MCVRVCENLTFGEGVRLNNVEESVDYVEEKPYGPRLVVGVGVVNRRGHEPEVQGFHRRRGALSAGVRLDLGRERAALLRRLLAACGPPAEQQHQPPCPQHGSESPVFNGKKRKEREGPDSYEEMGKRAGASGAETPVPLGDFGSKSAPQSTEARPPAATIHARGSGCSQDPVFGRSGLITDMSADTLRAFTLPGGRA